MEPSREQLVLEHLPSVRYIASRFSVLVPPCIEVGDLVGEGVFGLLAAVDRFDPARGVKFKTYAESRIRGAILDSLRRQDWLPRSLRRRSRKLSRIFKELEQRLGRPASEAEISYAAGISIEELRRLNALSNPPQPQNGDPRRGTQDADGCNIADQRADALLYLQQCELQDILADAISSLPPRERLVISLYYYDDLTMKEIGEVLGVRESRVSQFHSKAKSRLYSRLKSVLQDRPWF